MCIFFNDTATTEIYTLSLHDALPISSAIGWPGATTQRRSVSSWRHFRSQVVPISRLKIFEKWPEWSTIRPIPPSTRSCTRSEEHTSELQSRQYLVCRLLLEKKNKTSS